MPQRHLPSRVVAGCLSPLVSTHLLLAALIVAPTVALRAPSPALKSRFSRGGAVSSVVGHFTNLVPARFRQAPRGVLCARAMSSTATSSEVDICQFETEMVRSRTELATRVLAVANDVRRNGGAPAAPGPERLVVLAHGLSGTQDDLAYLSRAVLQRDRSSRILPLLARSNVDKTKDGVSSGGWRLANEILSLVEANPSIRSISLVGNSLGGLYVRYAVALLSLPGAPWKMCGLDAADLITTACPHLGVKDFTFVPIPSMLYAAAPLIFGRTGDDLLLKPPAGGAGPQRGGRTPLLEAMAISPLFLQGVRTFKRRRAYANLEGDFLVPFGTAAFHVVPNRPGWGLLEGSLSNAFVQNASPLNRAGSSPIECEMVLPPRDFPAPPVIDSAAARMAASLDACGWSKIGVRFRGPFPLSHNKMVALEGGGLFRDPVRWIWVEGRGVMDSLAEYIVSDYV
mmetsp:Transcript_17839/g.43097  ORF Transcript_17839/g.43097 Transcript_17839/m.43097 type:complete len:456 (+) Transcript_17839:171-1538(+)